MRDSESIFVPELAENWKISQHDGVDCLEFGDQSAIFELNHSSKLIIQQCDGVQTVEAISRVLASEFDEPAEDLQRDIKDLLRELAFKGAIRFTRLELQAPTVRFDPPQRPQQPAKLCIAMATFDDYDGVYFSIQSIRLFHPEVLEQVEFVLLDNNPAGPCADALKSLGDSIPNYRYVAGDNFQGTWSRFDMVHHTHAEHILCMDSHVMLAPGALSHLLDYLAAHPNSPDFIQGPLLADDGHSLSSHFKPGWGAGMYGSWALDPRAVDANGPAFDIPMQGLGVFAFNRRFWPKVNPRFKGFGGEEGYVHEKVRRAGGRTLCLPSLRWMHRFNRPMGAHYTLNWADRIRNYMIVHDELSLDTEPMVNHFRELIGAAETEKIITQVDAEIANPLFFFDAIYCINLDHETQRWKSVLSQFEILGAAHRVQRISAFETPENHHIGCALSHREIIKMAAIKGYQNVLVVEDDVIFDANALSQLADSVTKLAEIPWDILYLGGHCWGLRYDALEDCASLGVVTDQQHGPTCTHAVAYNASSYSKILAELPADAEPLADYFSQQYQAIDQYYSRDNSLQRLVMKPMIASQANILASEPDAFLPITDVVSGKSPS